MARSKVLLSPSKGQKPLLKTLIFELHSEIKIIMSFLCLTKKDPVMNYDGKNILRDNKQQNLLGN